MDDKGEAKLTVVTLVEEARMARQYDFDTILLDSIRNLNRCDRFSFKFVL